MASTMAGAGYRTAHTVRKRSRAGEHEGDMEGTTHAATGVIAGAAMGFITHAGPWSPVLVGGHEFPALPLRAAHIALFAVTLGGLALLSDADHPDASFAHAAGPVSMGISHLVTVLFGGHRQGMHSVPVLTAWALLVQTLAVWAPTQAGQAFVGVFLAICIAAALRATGFARSAFGALVMGALVAWCALKYDPGALWWLFSLGMAIHITEDEFTGHGCALWWPFSKHRVGGRQERKTSAKKTTTTRRPASGRPATKGQARGAQPGQGRPAAGPAAKAVPDQGGTGASRGRTTSRGNGGTDRARALPRDGAGRGGNRRVVPPQRQEPGELESDHPA